MMSERDTKRCSRCGNVLLATLESFGRDLRHTDCLQSRCRSCDREAGVACRRARTAERRVALAAHNKAYRESRKEHLAAYYERNRERRKVYRAAKYATNREEELAKANAYNAVHREECARLAREYARAHPDEVRARNRNRRARLKQIRGSHTASDVLAQHVRQHGRCYWCRAKVGDGYHVDHVTPIAKGGSNGLENLVIACSRCNLTKQAKHPMDFAGVLL